MKNIEILAPVGSVDSLYAAVENGANAVYLGGKLFNARHHASNFDDNELEKAVKYAHEKNVRVYVTVNILLDNSEIIEIIDYIIYLYNIDVDALIVQDLGLVRIIKKLLPDFEIHGSTQMTINNYMGVKFLEDLDFQRSVLARELSVDEIEYIHNNTDIELEGFVHGALCISYSGQCLMSSIIGGRSGNRGRCAQPCRMPYSIVKLSDDKVIKKDYDKKYLLSPKDLNTIDYLDKIVNSGISSLKIEGRMKRPEYVATIVSNYKKALDGITNEKKKESVTENDKKEIKQIFNRGFTKGFIMNEYGGQFISYDKPNNRGIYIGEVTKVDRNNIEITLEGEINKGDGIEFHISNDKNIGLTLNKIFKKGKYIEKARKGDSISIPRINGISLKTKIYKTSDTDLLSKARKSYSDKEYKFKIPLYMAIEVFIGKPVTLYITDNRNHITIKSERLVEQGKKIALTKEKIEEQMSKLGNTPYTLKDIQINLEEGAMISLSSLNKVRRKAIDQLNELRQNFNKRPNIETKDIKYKIEELFKYEINKDKPKKSSKKLSISVKDSWQLKKLDLAKVDRLYIPLLSDLDDCLKYLNNYDNEIFISLNRIINNDDFISISNTLDKIDISRIDGINVSNLGALKFIKDRYDTNINGDIGLNVFNSSAVQLLREYGLNSITLSPELTKNQISNITSSKMVDFEAIGYGYIPLMHMKHCPFSILKKCNSIELCNDCEFVDGYGLKDRKEMVFRLNREGETTILYNSQPIMIPEHIKEIYSSGIDIIRLDFTFEKEGIREIQEIYYDYANGKINKNEVRDFVNKYKDILKNGITKGHYFRGVL